MTDVLALNRVLLIALGVAALAMTASAEALLIDSFDNRQVAHSDDRTAFWATNDAVPEEVAETAEGVLRLEAKYNQNFAAVGIFTRQAHSDLNFWHKAMVVRVRGLDFVRNGSEVTPFQTQHHLSLSPTTGSLGRYQATTVAVRVTQSNQVTLSWKKDQVGPLAVTQQANQQVNAAAGGRVHAYDLHLDGRSGTLKWKFVAYADKAGSNLLKTWSGNMGAGLRASDWNDGGGSAMSLYCYKDSKGRNFIRTEIDSVAIERETESP